MKSVWVLLEGLDELRKALRDMPERLHANADVIVANAAWDTARELLSVYPGNGPLRRGVVVEDRSSALQSRHVVVSRSREAEWWEFGTQNRRTQKGWNRGAAPAHANGLIALARPHRKDMRRQLIEMLRGEGFAVHEDASG